MAIGLAAAGATLAVGAASALHVTGSGQDPEMSATAARSQSPHATSTAADTTATGRADAAPVGAGAPDAGSSARAARGVTDPKEGTVGEMAVGAIPGVGDLMMARIPAATRQVIVVTGADASATVNRVVRWERAGAGAPWAEVGTEIAGRNGGNGWTHDHVEGDRRSPVGVFSLTAAGGRYPDPGTALPYEYRPSFYQAGSYAGDPMAEAFNYVVAIDYNRLPGHPPSDPTRPLGKGAGGDIWLHVDHNSPTKGCISLPLASMEAMLHWLTPGSQPMIIMGDRASVEASSGR